MRLEDIQSTFAFSANFPQKNFVIVVGGMQCEKTSQVFVCMASV